MSDADASDWRDAVAEQRRSKDGFFAESDDSPIPRGDREDFDGLDYYQIDPAYRFELTFDARDEDAPIALETQAGGRQEFLHCGVFQFGIDGEPVTLHGYRADPDEDGLWIPFRDATNGDETYGAGRYLDVPAPDDGTWVVDFNRAYNPFCAYDDRYDCPVIPRENVLDVPIPAGERAYDA